MKKIKNFLCILLAVLMLVSAVCISTYATENSEEITNSDPSESTTQTVTTTETTASTLPDCDSKPVVIPTSDPTETTQEPSIPLTGSTDPSEATDPTETEPTSTGSATVPVASQEPSETAETTIATDPTETTTEPTVETDPADTTEPTEITDPTEATEPDVVPKLNKKKLSLEAGETFTLKVKHSEGLRVRYSSDNTKVAIVSSKGEVTALKKGTAKITAKTGVNKFVCKVTVTTNPKLKKAGKVVKTLTLKAGERTKVNLVGKAGSINNAYFNSPNAYFGALPTATKLSVVGRKAGTTTIKVRVNGVKYIKLKVIIK